MSSASIPVPRRWFELFVSFIPFLVFGHLLTKLRKYYIIFVYILLDKMGKTEKNRKENHTTKVTKIPKDYGMNETAEKKFSDIKLN